MNQEPDTVKSFALHSNPRCDQKWLKVDLQVILNEISSAESTIVQHAPDPMPFSVHSIRLEY